MQSSNEIIDAQVNYGDTPFGPDCDFETYNKNAEAIGITQAVIVPTPTHIHHTDKGTEVSCLWREGRKEISKRYYTENRSGDGQTNTVESPNNPYQQFNKIEVIYCEKDI